MYLVSSNYADVMPDTDCSADAHDAADTEDSAEAETSQVPETWETLGNSALSACTSDSTKAAHESLRDVCFPGEYVKPVISPPNSLSPSEGIQINICRFYLFLNKLWYNTVM